MRSFRNVTKSYKYSEIRKSRNCRKKSKHNLMRLSECRYISRVKNTTCRVLKRSTKKNLPNGFADTKIKTSEIQITIFSQQNPLIRVKEQKILWRVIFKNLEISKNVLPMIHCKLLLK